MMDLEMEECQEGMVHRQSDDEQKTEYTYFVQKSLAKWKSL